MEYAGFIISLGRHNKPITIKNNVKNKKETCTQSKIVNVIGKMLSYKENEVHVLYDDQQKAWVKCANVAKLLGYKDYDKIIRKYVSDCNKKSYNELILYNPAFSAGLHNIRNDNISLYMNKAGIFELLNRSRKKEALQFQYFVNNEVLVSIDEKGSYNIDGEDNDNIIFEKTNGIYEDYVINNSAFDIKQENILYLGYIGTVKHIGSICKTNFNINEEGFKYGITKRGTMRADEHKSKLENFIMFHVQKCIDSRDLEDALEYELKQKGLWRHCAFGKSNYTELFTTSDKFTINDIKKFIENWILKYDSKHKSDAIVLAEELTKQENIKLEQMKTELKILEIKVLCLEKYGKEI